MNANAPRGPWTWVALFLILGVAGAFTASRFFFQAFPEASIDLRLTRDEAARRSNDFLRGRGFSTSAFRQVTVFDFDENAKTYLERELGVEEANRVMSARVRLWRWQTRLVKPPDKEEFSVWLDTGGELAGFQHQVAENLAGATLSDEEAQRVAEVFLKSERRVDLTRYRLVAAERTARPRRLDHVYTWEEKDLKLKDATLRIKVVVLGDQVGEYREFVKIPEQWTRDYDRMRSRNNLLEFIATALYVLLLVGGAISLGRSARTHGVSWGAVILIGSVVGALLAMGSWNDFGLSLKSAPTNMTYETWAALYSVIAVLTGVFTALLVVLVAGAGDPLYRGLSPDRVSLAHLFTFRGMRTREFFTSTLIGYGMAGLHIGLVVLFYVLARRLGAWAPLDVKYNNAISTAAPWLYPLSNSVFAAANEEFTFRLLAIPLLLSWTRNKWVAVLVPAFLWGFLHSSYPQQPAWIRGIEVGSIGVLAGWVFLRFGILATLVWHYTVDAVLIGLFLLRSDHLSFRISGAMVGDAVLVPLVIAGVLALQSRGFVEDPSILNRAVEEKEADETSRAEEAERRREIASARPTRPFAFVARARLAALALAGALGIVVLAAVHVPRVGEAITIRAGAAQAERLAISYLNARGAKIRADRHVTFLSDEIPGSGAEYLRERMSARAVGRIFADQIPSVAWHTRFFRPLAKEEYIVLVSPEGTVQRYVHQLDEKAPGDKLEQAAAQQRAEAFLDTSRVQPRVRLSDYRLMEDEVETRDARTDHTLTWEAGRPIVGEAAHRVAVAVKGAEVTGPRHWVKVPEEWERLHTRPSLLTIFPILIFVGCGLGILGLFARSMTSARIHWRTHAWVGIGVALLQSISVVNSMPSWARSYDTSVPWNSALGIAVAVGFMSVLFSFIGAVALMAIAETFLVERFGPIEFWPGTREGRGRAVREAALAGVCAALFQIGAQTLVRGALDVFHTPVRGLDTGLPDYPVSFVPGLQIFLQVMRSSIWGTLLGTLFVAFVLRVLRGRVAIAIALVVGAAALAAGGSLSGLHFVRNWIGILASLGLFAALLPILRWNLPAWLVMSFTVRTIAAIAGPWRHPGLRPFAIEAGAGLVLVFVAALAAALTIRGAASDAPGTGAAPS